MKKIILVKHEIDVDGDKCGLDCYKNMIHWGPAISCNIHEGISLSHNDKNHIIQSLNRCQACLDAEKEEADGTE